MILIVGHGANLTASLRTLLGYKEPLLRKDGGLANASLTILETHDFETFTLILGMILLIKIIELDFSVKFFLVLKDYP